MSEAKPAKPIVWSFSSISKFDTCPYQWKSSYVLKNIPYKPHTATVWGQEVHDAMDKAFKTSSPLPERMKAYEKYVTAIKSIPGKLYSEYEMAIDAKGNRVGWWDKTAVERSKTDVSIFDENRCNIIDHKTGKYRPSDELEYFSLMTFRLHPEVEKTKTTFLWYQGDGAPTVAYYNRSSDLDRLENKYSEKIATIENALVYDKFPAKKSGLCQSYCGSPSCRFSGSFNGVGEV